MTEKLKCLPCDIDPRKVYRVGQITATPARHAYVEKHGRFKGRLRRTCASPGCREPEHHVVVQAQTFNRKDCVVRFKTKNGTTSARFYYVEMFGPLPSEVRLKRTCPTSGCVNPYHHEPRTENTILKIVLAAVGVTFQQFMEWQQNPSDTSSPCLGGPTHIKINNKSIRTARLLWGQLLGRTMHPSWQLRAGCPTRDCNNPRHYYLIQRVNMEMEPVPIGNADLKDLVDDFLASGSDHLRQMGVSEPRIEMIQQFLAEPIIEDPEDFVDMIPDLDMSTPLTELADQVGCEPETLKRAVELFTQRRL